MCKLFDQEPVSSISSFFTKICSSSINDLFLVSGRAARATSAPRRRAPQWNNNMPSIPIRLVKYGNA